MVSDRRNSEPAKSLSSTVKPFSVRGDAPVLTAEPPRGSQLQWTLSPGGRSPAFASESSLISPTITTNK